MLIRTVSLNLQNQMRFVVAIALVVTLTTMVALPTESATLSVENEVASKRSVAGQLRRKVPASKDSNRLESLFPRLHEQLVRSASRSTSSASALVNALDYLANRTQYSGLMSARGPTLQDSDILASLGYGYMDMRESMPNDPLKTRYPIASNTKILVTIIIFQLQEQGIIDIHDDVADHLTVEDFQKWGLPSMTKFCMSLYNDPSNTCQKITFEMLLGMSAGIVGSPDSPLLFMMEYVPMYVNISMMFGIQLPMMTLAFVPGTDYTYSDQNFMLLSYFVEKYTGMELGAAFEKFVLAPLGLHDTYFDRTNGLFAFDPARTEEGFRYFLYDPTTQVLTRQLGTGKCQNDLDTGTLNGAGGAVSTLKDEATLFYCLYDMSYGDDAPNPHCPFNSSLAPSKLTKYNVLSMASRRKIISPYVFAGSSPVLGSTFYAMGMFVSNKTGPYAKRIADSIAYGGPPQSGPTYGEDDVVYPSFVSYTGDLSCVYTANVLALQSRVDGNIAFMAQSYEAQRAMASADPNAVPKARANEQVSMYGFPDDMSAVYTADSISIVMVQLVNGTLH